MQVNREELLNQLQSVEPGLSKREVIEQSSCFVFQGGRVMTYNDEIACTYECSLDIEGAVEAKPLLALLSKLNEQVVDISISPKGEFLVKGKNKRAGIRIEQEVLLPIGLVEKPKKWTVLPSDFTEAVSIVKECAGKDETQFALTCVHIHPDWIEACDRYQSARYTTKTNVRRPILVRKDSIQFIDALGMEELSETKHWIHFQNKSGLVVSCRRWLEKYPDLTEHYKVKGSAITFPKGLSEAAEKAEVFTFESLEENHVTINLQPGKLQLTGRGVSGYYQERKTVKYNGPSFSFTIAPLLLGDLVKKHNKCLLSKGTLKVSTGKYTYISVLQVAKK